MKDPWNKYHNKGGKERAPKYHAASQEVLRADARNKYRRVSKTEKDKKKEISERRYHMNTDLNEELNQYQRNCYLSK